MGILVINFRRAETVALNFNNDPQSNSLKSLDFLCNWKTASKNMASVLVAFLSSLIAMLLLLPSGAEAFDGGDTVALLLGLIIGISGILACLGAYARRKGMA